ncbi:shikimate kinase [Pontivivens insulae]|uniref:Shikimate kinase n=1 Tax=Pontivivens insulae TaxID=1639689 RepID=A0A2R8AAS6_9RHOB|nr:shikimate kinase [Pontivivens insulae]RED13242.1 shikimate kinase [Pontivivens insulae]SPF29334.1 Shikimate kinase 1 [Pontivivens insulae]
MAPETTLTRPIVLIGLMGAGKTSVGRKLASALRVPFRDSDAEIVKAAGQSIPQIFATLGEPAFRDGERRVIARLLGEKPSIIATGGGAWMDAETRAAVAAQGTSIWIDATVETLWNRVRDKTGRPLLDEPDPRGVLEALAAARYPVYAQAELRVLSEAGQTHEAMVDRIIAALKSAGKIA